MVPSKFGEVEVFLEYTRIPNTLLGPLPGRLGEVIAYEGRAQVRTSR